MKALARGFLAGFGFALGASVAGTLIGYTIGRIGEASVKRLLSSERTSSPAPSSSPASSEQCCPAAADGHNGWCTVATGKQGVLTDEEMLERGWGFGYAAHKDESETDAQNASEHCGVLSPNGPFGSLTCSLSRGHTKPIEHWDSGRGVSFIRDPQGCV